MVNVIDNMVKKGASIRKTLEIRRNHPLNLQRVALQELLSTAQNTAFGKEYQFKEILSLFHKRSSSGFYEKFTEHVPIHDYNKIYDHWWCKAKEGKEDICWPGKIKYFALSSGTSGAASKYIPITKQMLKSVRKTSIKQIFTLHRYDLPIELFNKKILMLGGSTDLQKHNFYYEGDLSGITTSKIPLWLQHHYKPGRKIAKTKDWHDKLNEITEKAPKWDIGVIVGVPAWLQILMEKIVERYQVKTIHDIWPNLSIFVHGGVPFEPYKKGFEKLLAKDLVYIETYLASEGFLAFQAYPNRKSMKLVLNNGIFFEFIPFNQDNFNEDGEVHENPQTLNIGQIEEGKEYALLISTNAGIWRYLIGDVVRIVDKSTSEIVITGRTKHFISLCGEHLSSDNMNKAIELTEKALNVDIREFTVIGESYETLFAHRWYVGTKDAVAPEVLQQHLDQYLMELNDDYRVERAAALKEITVQVLPSSMFYSWMEKHSKIGGQSKFPRVLKGEKAEAWKAYIK